MKENFTLIIEWGNIGTAVNVSAACVLEALHIVSEDIYRRYKIRGDQVDSVSVTNNTKNKPVDVQTNLVARLMDMQRYKNELEIIEKWVRNIPSWCE